MKKLFCIIFCLATAGMWTGAARNPGIAPDKVPGKISDNPGYVLEYVVTEEGDTVFVDCIEPAFVFPKGTRVSRNLRQYYRLVYNFNKVYPYVSVARKVVDAADSAIAGVSKAEKDRYVSGVQRQLLKDFSPVVHSMTMSQGKILVRLVNREIGRTSYDLVKDYKNGVAAVFWQGVGRLFGQNLKSRYDPEGDDKITEELVQSWENGTFDQLYFSIFYELPPRTVVPSKYR